MGLLNDFQLITESETSKVKDSDLYIKSDGIIFTYNRLVFALDSNNLVYN